MNKKVFFEQLSEALQVDGGDVNETFELNGQPEPVPTKSIAIVEHVFLSAVDKHMGV